MYMHIHVYSTLAYQGGKAVYRKITCHVHVHVYNVHVNMYIVYVRTCIYMYLHHTVVFSCLLTTEKMDYETVKTLVVDHHVTSSKPQHLQSEETQSDGVGIFAKFRGEVVCQRTTHSSLHTHFLSRLLHATKYLQPTAPVLKAGHPVSYFIVCSLGGGFFLLLSFYLLVCYTCTCTCMFQCTMNLSYILSRQVARTRKFGKIPHGFTWWTQQNSPNPVQSPHQSICTCMYILCSYMYMQHYMHVDVYMYDMYST